MEKANFIWSFRPENNDQTTVSREEGNLIRLAISLAKKGVSCDVMLSAQLLFDVT